MAAPTSNTTPTSMPATLVSIAPWTHALLRIGAGLLYMEHGLQKLFGMFGGMAPGGRGPGLPRVGPRIIDIGK